MTGLAENHAGKKHGALLVVPFSCMVRLHLLALISSVVLGKGEAFFFLATSRCT